MTEQERQRQEEIEALRAATYHLKDLIEEYEEGDYAESAAIARRNLAAIERLLARLEAAPIAYALADVCGTSPEDVLPYDGRSQYDPGRLKAAPAEPVACADEGCLRCGKCCGADPATASDDGCLGGDEATNAALRLPSGECRHLLPANEQGERLCAIHGTSEQPQFCRMYPFVDPIIHAGCAFEQELSAPAEPTLRLSEALAVVDGEALNVQCAADILRPRDYGALQACDAIKQRLTALAGGVK